MLQYADDTTGILKDDCSLKSLLDVINSFEKISGLKINISKLENAANWWKGRGLTLYGRAQIINSLLLPRLIYIATMFAVPKEVIKDINRIVFKFLWRGQDRVVRTAMINSYENGGLRVLDFETVRLSWLKRVFTSENTGWRSYLTHLLKPFGGLFLLHCDYDPKDHNISNQLFAELRV